VEAVDILARRNRLEDLPLVDMLRQGELHQDAVDPLIPVQALDQRQQFRFAGVGRQLVFIGKDPGLLAGLLLHRNVDPAGRVVADQHHGEPGSHPAGLQLLGFLRDGAAQPGGDGLAVDDLVHLFSPPKK